MKKATIATTNKSISIKVCFDHKWQDKAFKSLEAALNWCNKHHSHITWVNSLRTMHKSIDRDAMEVAFA